MEVVKVISEAHEGAIVSLAYNKTRREIYSSADGDKIIKVDSVVAVAPGSPATHLAVPCRCGIRGPASSYACSRGIRAW